MSSATARIIIAVLILSRKCCYFADPWLENTGTMIYYLFDILPPMKNTQNNYLNKLFQVVSIYSRSQFIMGI